MSGESKRGFGSPRASGRGLRERAEVAGARSAAAALELWERRKRHQHQAGRQAGRQAYKHARKHARSGMAAGQPLFHALNERVGRSVNRLAYLHFRLRFPKRVIQIIFFDSNHFRIKLQNDSNQMNNLR